MTQDPVAAWAVEQQAVAEAAVEHNKTAVLVRGCVLCGRVDTPTCHESGLADRPVCADWEGCAARVKVLHGTDGDWRRKPKPDGGQIHG